MASLQTTVSLFTRTLEYLRRSRSGDEDLESLKMSWARETLDSFGVDISVRGAPVQEGPVLLVGNHISYLDIPVLLSKCRGLSFVAKSEVRKWPVIGAGAVTLGTTFVDRADKSGRTATREQIAGALKSGARIAVFPSGTTCVDESKSWKRGAFEIAKQIGIPIQPFRLIYEPLRVAAYIDKDFFPVHLFHLAQAERITGLLEFHPPVSVEDPESCCAKWRDWTRAWS